MIKIYALSKEGNSFLIHVKEFIPYFYVPFPNGLVNTEENIRQFKMELNKIFKSFEESKRSKEFLIRNPIPEESVLHLEPVKKVNLFGYVPKERENDL